MTNELYTFISVLKNTLKDLSSFKRVGEYPYDVKFAETDGNSPMVLIQEGDEEIAEVIQNGVIPKAIMISIWLYLDTNTIRTKTITDLQTVIEEAVTSADFRTSSGAFCVKWDSVDKGEYLDEYTGYDIGYNNSKTVRKINFIVSLNFERTL